VASNRRILNLGWFSAKLRDRRWRLTRLLNHRRADPIQKQVLYLNSARNWPIAIRVWGDLSSEPARPAVLAVPGLGQSSAYFERWSSPIHLAEIARMGMIAVAVDLSGRGESWGVEDYGGPIHQDDVLSTLSEMVTWSGVDPRHLGVLSHSLGCAAVAKALAAPNRPEVQWWIDVEGPSDREIITAGGKIMEPADGHLMHDETYWNPREAYRWVGEARVGYLRVQGLRDHAQPGEFRHAKRMLEVAANGSLPWFRLNEHPVDENPLVPEWLDLDKPGFNRWLCAEIQKLHPC